MIDLIVVPYDSGRRNFRMGRGPEHFIQCGLVGALEAAGSAVQLTTVETAGDDVTAAFDLADRISQATREAVRHGRFPIILAGNCMASLGGFAGRDSQDAVLWLDAHADFNTPATSPSGFLDGMALAIITGRCHHEAARAVPGFRPLRDEALVMLGVRAVDAGEQESVDRVIAAMNVTQLRAALAAIETATLYLHVDLDVLDPSSLNANEFATAGGLTTDTVIECIGLAARTKRIAALALTAYDPAADPANAAFEIVRRIIERVTTTRHSQHAVGTKAVRGSNLDTLLDQGR